MKNIVYTFLLSLSLFSCSSTKKQAPVSMDKGSQLIEKAIIAHGGSSYDRANYSFEFRGVQYTVHFYDGGFRYTRVSIKDSITTADEMTNDSFIRTINGEKQEIKTEDLPRFRNSSINSVIYFAMLPYKLQDAAVQKKHLGETKVKFKMYDMVQVTFAQEGGGKDHEDTFLYWLGKEDQIIDYLAYNYKVNGGGVRFRVAYNPRIVDGIRFQDYVNYKAPIGTPLENLPALYEAGELEELSKIELENIKSVMN